MYCFFFIIYFASIAPGTYDVEKADRKIHESSPAYSLGVKPKERQPEDIPGKSSYEIKNKNMEKSFL